MLKRKQMLITAVFLILSLVLGSTGIALGNSSQQQSWLVHIVQSGDSLWKIGNQYGVTVSVLRQQNGLASDMILDGQALLVKPVGTKVSYFLYQVRQGDTPWLLSQRFKAPLSTLLEVNNFNQSVVLYPGNIIRIPYLGSLANSNYQEYTVKAGDTPWLISRRFNVPLAQLLQINGLNENSVIYVGQKLKIPTTAGASTSQQTQSNLASRSAPNDGPRVTYITHTVQKGETPWTISIKYGIPMAELLKLNGLTEKDYITAGQKLTVPVYHIPVKPTVSPNHGELLDWWTEAQYLWPMGKKATIIDFYTKKSWQVIRSYGAFHADVEPLTAADAAVMKQVWGGKWSWDVRPVLVVVDGRKIAASASAMPHDIQDIKNNNFNGHFDVHFLNSRRHKDYEIDQAHQNAVYIAAGQQR